MKRFLLVILIYSSFISCSKDNLSLDYPQSFILTKMNSSFEGSETTGNAMEWQESYCLFENNTFIKSRDWNGSSVVAEGTYKFSTRDNENIIEFTFKKESIIIGSCYGNLKEIFHKINSSKIKSTWSHCDGPGLEYERSEVCGIN